MDDCFAFEVCRCGSGHIHGYFYFSGSQVPLPVASKKEIEKILEFLSFSDIDGNTMISEPKKREIREKVKNFPDEDSSRNSEEVLAVFAPLVLEMVRKKIFESIITELADQQRYPGLN